MTPPRTATNTTQPTVATFPVFRVVIAADGASATLNSQPVPTSGHPDLLTAVHAAAGAAAADLGRPVRMDLTTPTGQTRHLIAQPTGHAGVPKTAPPEAPDVAYPVQPAVAEVAESESATSATAAPVLDQAPDPDADLDREPQPNPPTDQLPIPGPGTHHSPITATAPLPTRGDAVTTSPTTPTAPPAPPVNGTSQHDRLTPLEVPLSRPVDPRPAPDPRAGGRIAAGDQPHLGAPELAPAAIPLTRAVESRPARGPRPPRGQPAPAPTPAAPPTADPTGDAPAMLTPAGLLTRLRPTTARPTVGWQARVHTWTRGRWSPPPSAAEIRYRVLVAAVQAGFTGPRLVAVVNPKGGAGKTPAVLATAATWGAHRGSVVAWDDNETRGTLAMRALADPRNPTVAGLLADLARFEDAHARIGDLAAHLRPQGGARFDVLASDDDPARMAEFGATEFIRVRDVLARFYAITVVDTGNNVRAGNWQAAVDAADQLLLVSTYQRDAAVTASWTLDHLRATGRGHLADEAVTVLSAATPITDRRTRTALRDHFQARTRAVVEIPYDPVIADGEHLDLRALRPATRNAWLAATAALTEGLTR